MIVSKPLPLLPLEDFLIYDPQLRLSLCLQIFSSCLVKNSAPSLALISSMTPSYYSSFYPFPIDLNEDQPQEHFSPQHVTEATSSSSSLLLYPNFIYQHGEGGGCFDRESGSLKLEEEANDKRLSHGGSLDHATLKNEENGNVLKFSLSKKEYKEENHSDTSSSIKWMSSKMRLMKKMMSSDQTVPDTTIRKFRDNKEISLPSNTDNNSSNNSSNNSNNAVRVCSDCNTTKTPLWRSGPRGPKSLCNACGIRQRKARRAMAAAGANGTVFTTKQPTAKTKVQHKEKKTNNSHLPLKKRCKFTAQSGGSKNLCFEDLSIIFSKNSAFHGVFPQDEKEAAILLMAISQGLVRG